MCMLIYKVSQLSAPNFPGNRRVSLLLLSVYCILEVSINIKPSYEQKILAMYMLNNFNNRARWINLIKIAKKFKNFYFKKFKGSLRQP